MAKYKYHQKRNFKLFGKILSVVVILIGAGFFAYTFFPLISWQIYFAPAFASQKIDAPIPQQTIINPASVTSLISTATKNAANDYTNANNWYPSYNKDENFKVDYTISIPKIGIEGAEVTNKDTDLTRHLVQYNSDTHPPKMGNSVIFGHSTLPQLYDRNNYKTIFANAYKLGVGDQILVTIKNETHRYKIESVTVVDPGDTSVLAQNFTDSFITIITCTPPGTIWKRLIIKARLQEL